MKKETLLATTSCMPDEHRGIVNVPPYRASTVLFPTFADFEKAESHTLDHPNYARYGTRSTEALESAIAAVEDADHAIVTSSGLSAIVLALMAFVKSGDHILMVDTVYGPARRFCDHELKNFGVEVTYYDPLVGAGISSLIRDNTRVVYLESPGSQTFEMQDIPAIVKAARAKKDIIVMGDNTWATPLYSNAFKLGMDISIHAATKYINGHSDLVMGVVTCKEKHFKQLNLTSYHLGLTPGADNCYLAMRGLRTMKIRMEHQFKNALTVAEWIKKQPVVEEVLYPALPGTPGHDAWKRDFGGGASLFGVALKPASRDQIAAMFDGFEYFGMGYSWGGFESLAIITDPRKTRTVTKWPYSGLCLRLHIGLEHPDDLIRDLEAGFGRMKTAKAA